MAKRSTKPIAAHITPFLEYCEVERGLSNLTQESYAHYLALFVGWLRRRSRPDCLPHELTAEDIWNYRLYLARSYRTKAGKRLSRRSQNHYLIGLRALLTYLQHRDVEAIAASHVSLSKAAKGQPPTFLTFPEVLRVLEIPDVTTSKGLRDRAILELLFSTGLRISELVALDRPDIAGIDQTSDRSFEISVTGKGNVTRTAYISPRAANWITKYLGSRRDDLPPLFTNLSSRVRDRRRLTPRAIQMTIVKTAALAGISKKITPHTLRHSYATDLLTRGADLRSVQELLGHKNVATTQIYTHLTNQQLRSVHERFHATDDQCDDTLLGDALS